MSEAHQFEIFCPNNHDQIVTYTLEQFNDALKSEGLVLHCNTCDTNWTLSHDQIDKIRKKLAS